MKMLITLFIVALTTMNIKSCGGSSSQPASTKSLESRIANGDTVEPLISDMEIKPNHIGNQALLAKLMFEEVVDVSNRVNYVYYRKSFSKSQYYAIDIFMNTGESTHTFANKYDFKLVVSEDSSVDSNDEYFSPKNVTHGQGYMTVIYDTQDLRINGVPFKTAQENNPYKLKWTIGIVFKSVYDNTGHLWNARYKYTNNQGSQSEGRGSSFQPTFGGGR